MAKQMRPYLIASIAAFLALGLFAGLFKIWREQTEPNAAISDIGRIEAMEKTGVPDFSGPLIGGGTFQSRDLQNAAIVVNFWATWCGPCVQEVPSLIELVKASKGALEVVAISEDTAAEDITAFLKAFPDLNGNPHIHIVLDENRKLMKSFGVDRLPESFVLNPKRRLVKKIVGSIDWHTPASEEFVRNVRDQK